MKTFSTILLFTALLAVVSFGCKKKDLGPVITVTPSLTQFTKAPGSLVEFSINMSSEVGLKRLRITRNIDNSVTQTELDTLISGNNAVVTHVYTVPQQGVQLVSFIFTLTDNDERQVATPRKIVVEGAAVLQESTGHQLYSIYAGSSANRFFSIENAVVSQDSANISIMDYDQLNDDVLSRQWTSGLGLQFARFDSDGFNYASATFNSAKNSYQGAVKTNIVNNIQEGDKIITKYSDNPEAYAVFDIIEIFDGPGSANDRYRFNMKK